MSPEPKVLDRIEVLLKSLSDAEEEVRRLRAEIANELAKRRLDPADSKRQDQTERT
jgi:hypothetical protein